MSNSSFQHSVAVLGPGLLGGSLALAMQSLCPDSRVTLWGRRAEAITEALELGVLNATQDLAEALEHAEIIVLATPVGAMQGLLEKALPLLSHRRCLITDVGSVKRQPNEVLTPLLTGTSHSFIGSHPMAGSEKKGMTAAQSDLFEGAACAVTAEEFAADADVRVICQLWNAVGCRVSLHRSAAHDEAVAYVSHFPHILASVCADIALREPEEMALAGGGLRDTSRVASGDPDMWTEILLENRDFLVEPLQQSIERLREVLACLENSEHDQLKKFLQSAKQKRDHLTSLL